MRVAKAKRRWIKWCRYIDKTNSRANYRRTWGTALHDGQVRAYTGVMYARRYAPIGTRQPHYPKWGMHR